MRDELCRRFMAIPGVGPVTARSFSTAIKVPARFRRSRDVAAYFGLTSKRWQSGTSIDVKGRISKAGDPDVRCALYEAASALLTRSKGSDILKSWGLKLAKTKCHAKARVPERHKPEMVAAGAWGATRPEIRGHAGFRTNALTSLHTNAAWRSFLFSADLPPVWFEQLASERSVVRYSRGQPTRSFIRIPGRRAEALDCVVYAYAARALLNLDYDQHRADLSTEAAPAPKRAPVLASSWMQRR